MSELSFALFAAYENGASVESIATKLELPENWVRERIAAAELCLAVVAD